MMTAIKDNGPSKGSHKIDLTAPAGSKNSLGAESVRDGRPNTDDETVEAIDEMGPGVAAPVANTGKGRS
jgi:hypothetical protein